MYVRLNVKLKLWIFKNMETKIEKNRIIKITAEKLKNNQNYNT